MNQLEEVNRAWKITAQMDNTWQLYITENRFSESKVSCDINNRQHPQLYLPLFRRKTSDSFPYCVLAF